MKERIIQKIGRVREYLKLIKELKPDCEKKFTTDSIYRGALLYYLYLMADTSVALATAMIKYESLRPPQSYHEAFDILGDARILEPSFAYSFAKIAGFRNFLAHDYDKVDAKYICGDILNMLGEVEVFLRQIEERISTKN